MYIMYSAQTLNTEVSHSVTLKVILILTFKLKSLLAVSLSDLINTLYI